MGSIQTRLQKGSCCPPGSAPARGLCRRLFFRLAFRATLSIAISCFRVDATGLRATALSSPPPVEWRKSHGGEAGETCSVVIQTKDGGLLAGGFSTSGPSGDKSSPECGWLDYWIVKMDAARVCLGRSKSANARLHKAGRVLGVDGADNTDREKASVSLVTSDATMWVVESPPGRAGLKAGEGSHRFPNASGPFGDRMRFSVVEAS